MDEEPNSKEREWIEGTLFDIREGSGDPAEVEKLRAVLARSPGARRTYLRWNLLDCMLEMPASESRPNGMPRAARGPLGYWLAGMAGAGLAASLIFLMSPGREGPRKDPAPVSGGAVAKLLASHNTVVDGTEVVSPRGINKGSFDLDRGVAQLAFRNGAQIVLEGHCGFELINESTVVLSHGKMWAYCPSDARGFKVLAPNGAEIIDLGTEFGVEVGTSGETKVHVFDGLVDVVGPATGKRRLEAGEALGWADKPGSVTESSADPAHFITIDHLSRMRWQDHRERMMQRDDVLLFFDGSTGNGGTLRNLARDAGPRGAGRITGANRVAGRVGDKHALEFSEPGDQVGFDLDLPPGTGSFTLAMWVKVDRFDASYATLLNADGWEPGDLHFQIARDGRLRSGYHSGPAFESVDPSIKPGQWQLVAVSWDVASREARIYTDGRRLTLNPQDNRTVRDDSVPPRLGSCQLGSWRTKSAGASAPTQRDLKGRIDEVMIFNRALDDGEMAALYEESRP